jgi:hypothetical protein
MANEKTVIRKRQQIQKANKMMFAYVAGASAVVGLCLVLAVSLAQQAIFNERVLYEKRDSLSTIRDNQKNADELINELRVLNTNPALRSVPSTDSQNPLRVVLDALPAEANSVALGASLEEKLLNDPAITVDNITVQPIVGVESDEVTGGEAGSSEYAIPFSFSISANVENTDALRDVMEGLERSIRTIRLTSYEVERRGNQISLDARGEAFYQPSANLNLRDEEVK